MRNISPTQSPSRSRLSGSEADSKDQSRGRPAAPKETGRTPRVKYRQATGAMSEQTERVSRQSRLQGPLTLVFLHTVLSRVARRYYRTAYWGDHLFFASDSGSAFHLQRLKSFLSEPPSSDGVLSTWSLYRGECLPLRVKRTSASDAGFPLMTPKRKLHWPSASSDITERN